MVPVMQRWPSIPSYLSPSLVHPVSCLSSLSVAIVYSMLILPTNSLWHWQEQMQHSQLTPAVQHPPPAKGGLGLTRKPRSWSRAQVCVGNPAYPEPSKLHSGLLLVVFLFARNKDISVRPSTHSYLSISIYMLAMATKKAIQIAALKWTELNNKLKHA